MDIRAHVKIKKEHSNKKFYRPLLEKMELIGDHEFKISAKLKHNFRVISSPGCVVYVTREEYLEEYTELDVHNSHKYSSIAPLDDCSERETPCLPKLEERPPC